MKGSLESASMFDPLSLNILAGECKAELLRICHWWDENVIVADGFVGEIDHDLVVKPLAPRGVVLAARLLWFYSEAGLFLSEQEHQSRWKKIADHLYQYIVAHFIDTQHGGVFWEVSANGRVTNNRKQIYAQAFAVYALSAYYRLSKNHAALELALDIFTLIERYGLDSINGGYCEAFSREWNTLDDIRLSEKDLNSAKSMNTHLHILEAYTGLYLASKNSQVKSALVVLIDCYSMRFPFADTAHLKMFMTASWQDESVDYSYGHDIESSWLLWQAIIAVEDGRLAQQGKQLVLKLAEACKNEGIESDGALVDAYSLIKQAKIEDRVWWVQAEAMVGFFNAYEITQEENYIVLVQGLWQFLKSEIIDAELGEWRWMAKGDPKGKNYYTAGFWKGPYHNGRALIEVCRRIQNLQLA